jgi:DNA modification methylase
MRLGAMEKSPERNYHPKGQLELFNLTNNISNAAPSYGEAKETMMPKELAKLRNKVVDLECNTKTAPASPRSLLRNLEAIDWSFADRGKGHQLEALHPYPAKFIPDIPASFLSALPIPPGTVVLDPFCGSGTTLTEAQRRGIRAVGIDLNPIACLISRVRTTPAPPRLDIAASKVAATARANQNPVRWAIPNVDHWFKRDVQEAIAAIVHAIKEYPVAATRDALRLALSSVLVRVSNQESDTRYAAIEKNITGIKVTGHFLAACKKIEQALAAREWSLSTTEVIQADALKLPSDAIGSPVGMVITSPPYPNAYEYWLYHKYRMWWLGFDPLSVKSQEIGARAHFFKRDHHTAEDFRPQMRKVFELIDAVLVHGGFVCFVIGRSRIHGQIVDNADIIEGLAIERRYTQIARIERVIAPYRKSFNLSHANIKTESVLVFQKA